MEHNRATRLTRVLLLALLTSLVTSAIAQNSSIDKFQSEHKAVTIERFDPKPGGVHKAVIVVHGAGGPNGGWRQTELHNALTSAGYVVFVPHYFEGSGGEWLRSNDTKQFVAYIRTLNDAVRFGVEQAGVNKNEIGLLGFSLGGYLVLGLAEEEVSHPPAEPGPKIKAVVEMYGGMPEFAAERLISMPPVLILHGDKDDTVPVERAYELEKLLKKKSLPYEMKIYPGQGHGFEGAAVRDANGRTINFLKAHLN